MDKPFSQACENNKLPISNVLKNAFSNSSNVLEIGSGTGQHAVFLAWSLPHLKWQPSDRIQNLEGISMWIDEFRGSNIIKPIELDVRKVPRNLRNYDAIFSANTFHIMEMYEVECFFKLVKKHLNHGGRLCIYGPFNYKGQFTSESNRNFDTMLKKSDPKMGIRDFSWVASLAAKAGLSLVNDYEMPANNRLLEWKKANKKD